LLGHSAPFFELRVLSNALAGGPVGADDPQRQTDQLVLAGRHAAERQMSIQALTLVLAMDQRPSSIVAQTKRGYRVMPPSTKIVAPTT
jgi:hypothetical protein